MGQKESIFLRLYLFSERGSEGEKGRETPLCGCLSHAPFLGTWPATQAYAQTGNRTSNLPVCRLALGPLNHTSQDITNNF